VRQAIRRGTLVAGAAMALCAGCGASGSKRSVPVTTTPANVAAATASTGAAPSSRPEPVTTTAGGRSNTDSSGVSFDVPARWVTNEVAGLPAGEQKWRVSLADNEAVEKQLAERYGLTASLPLYDPSGTITEAELAALGDPLARGGAYIEILVGDPPHIANGENTTDLETAPWSTLDDVQAYLTSTGRSGGATPVSVAGLDGYSYTFTFAPLTTKIYELILRPGRRLFVSIYPADTRHLVEAEAIVGSIRARS
jgi:hypothetical protein